MGCRDSKAAAPGVIMLLGQLLDAINFPQNIPGYTQNLIARRSNTREMFTTARKDFHTEFIF